MKNKIFSLMAVLSLVLAGIASAANTTCNPVARFQTPITSVTDTNIVLAVARTATVLSYNDIDAAWSLSTAAGIKFSADFATNMVISAPTTVALSSGTKTANMALVSRCDTAGYAANKTAGTDCGATFATGADGLLYLSVFPTSLVLAQDAGATYAGSITITIDYQ